LACGLAVAAAHLAAAAGPSEVDVKAAFLFNFTKFVDWPEAAGAKDPITICVLGENPFGSVLGDAVRGKTVNGREVVVQERSTSGAATCNIVFIASSEQARLDEVLGRLATRPVLTVSDAEAAAKRGAIIGLTTEKNRVRFEVNLNAAKTAGLKLSSHLLKVAVRLIGRDQGP
jgi:hypothetical protein